MVDDKEPIEGIILCQRHKLVFYIYADGASI